MASLFGIPTDRMRVPRIVAGSKQIDLEVEKRDLCADIPSCGPHGRCYDGGCVCADGWATPEGCAGGDCSCSYQLGCPAECSTCNAASGACTSCSPLSATPLLVPAEGRCVGVCPSNQIASPSGSCHPCHSTCGGACDGPRADQCTSCDVIGAHAFLRNGECVLRCGDGYYADQDRVCHPCHSTCKQCSGPRATDCLACTPHACAKSRCPSALTPMLDGTSCVSACPAGRFADAKTSECVPCSSECRECNGPSAKHCVDPTPLTPFTDDDCAPGALRAGARCALPPCFTRGHYVLPTATSRECVACDNFDCAACDPADPSACLSCKNDWIRPVLVGSVCVERAAACGTGQYVTTSGTCAACDASCAACDGPAAESCLSCGTSGGQPFFDRGACVSVCPSGFAANATGHCLPCHYGCATCTAPGDAQACMACNSGGSRPFFDSLTSNCTTFCGNGRYGSAATSACEACPAECTECASPSTCTACVEGRQPLSGACVLTGSREVADDKGAVDELVTLAADAKYKAENKELDTGLPLSSVG